MNIHRSRPPREVVSWKTYADLLICCAIGRPPREVVSWKNSAARQWIFTVVDLHERSWVEKRKELGLNSQETVDLHERSWVEKFKGFTFIPIIPCRSPREVVSWKKCSEEAIADNTCRSPREVVSWKNTVCVMLTMELVDLHERSWVEKILTPI